jgi:predicted permease
MLVVLGGILPPITVLMTLMVLGLVLGRAKVLGTEFNKALNFLLLKITLPCLIVVSMQKPFSVGLAALGGWAWLISFFLYAGLFVASGLLVRWTPYEEDKKGIYRFALMFSNVGFMGFPLMEALWGRDSVFLGALFNVNFNLFVFSVGIWVLTRHKAVKGVPWKEILLNPPLLATVVGFLLFLTSTALPPLIYRVTDTLGGLTTPLSMILIGSLLAQSSLRTVWKGKGIWGLSALRLLFIPVVVWALLLPWNLPHEVTRLAVLVAAMPAAANTSMLAVEHTERPEVAGQAVFLTTALSFATIPLMVFLLGLG